jgi:hypothetical protein
MNHKKPQVLKGLGYFLFVFCTLGGLPSQGKENFTFTVFAEVTSEVYRDDSPTPSHVYRYSVTLRSSNDWWEISSRPMDSLSTPKFTQYFGIIPDGTRHLFLFDDYTNSLNTTMASASRYLYPNWGEKGLFGTWLCFCPHPPLPFVSNQKMSSLAKISNAPTCLYDVTMLSPDNWFLQSLSLTNDGRGMNPQGILFKFREPYQNGHLFFEYKVLNTTNSYGHIFPESAVFYDLGPKDDGKLPSELKTNVVTSIHLTHIINRIEPYKLPSEMVVDDERPAVLPHGRPVRYGVANDVWYPVTNDLVLRSIR